MSYFRITNNAGVPVHVAVSTAGVIQYHTNDVRANGGYTDFDVRDGIWHDLTVIPSNGQNQINAKENNGWKIAEITVGVLGVVAAAAAAPFTGGSSIAIAVAIGGALVTLGDTVASVANFAMHPATIDNLFAPDGYNFTVSGGNLEGHKDEQSGKFIVTGYNQITVHWHNNKTGNNGDAAATGR